MPPGRRGPAKPPDLPKLAGPHTFPLRAKTASSASLGFSKVTKPKPRERPVSRLVMTVADHHIPAQQQSREPEPTRVQQSEAEHRETAGHGAFTVRHTGQGDFQHRAYCERLAMSSRPPRPRTEQVGVQHRPTDSGIVVCLCAEPRSRRRRAPDIQKGCAEILTFLNPPISFKRLSQRCICGLPRKAAHKELAVLGT